MKNIWLKRLLLTSALVGVLLAFSGSLPLTGVFLGAFVSICLGIVMVLAW